MRGPGCAVLWARGPTHPSPGGAEEGGQAWDLPVSSLTGKTAVQHPLYSQLSLDFWVHLALALDHQHLRGQGPNTAPRRPLVLAKLEAGRCLRENLARGQPCKGSSSQRCFPSCSQLWCARATASQSSEAVPRSVLHGGLPGLGRQRSRLPGSPAAWRSARLHAPVRLQTLAPCLRVQCGTAGGGGRLSHEVEVQGAR